MSGRRGGRPAPTPTVNPFRFENWLFMHNGAVADFSSVRRDLTFAVDPSLYPDIRGTTDSEVLFHLALTHGLREDPIAAMRKTIRLVESIGHDHGVPFPMQGTVAVTDGITIWAFRYSTQGQTRSLFHSAEVAALEEMYPDIAVLSRLGANAHVVVSEPLSDLPGMFLEVPESTVAILDRSGYHHRPFTPADR
jgi:predicted glutamine amidotransferase